MTNLTQLSKAVSHALRHAPEQYDLKPESQGWVELDKLVDALKASSIFFTDLQKEDIYRMIEQSKKKRHEINGARIRAIYGHSADIDLNYVELSPPDKLYHGTSMDAGNAILTEGLKPMQRQYVHLSPTVNDALVVGKRKDSNPIVLEIDAHSASINGIKFYQAENIWLSRFIPAEYINIHDED